MKKHEQFFAFYYIPDPKIVEIGFIPDSETSKSEYFLNGLIIN
jgi:hypothetical protein